jgi:hypothetical protein
MKRILPGPRVASLLFFFLCGGSPASGAVPADSARLYGGLSVIALGDAGDNNGVLRGCGAYVTNMHTGQHDAGTFDLLFFLGDTFGPTGLNIPVGDVQKAWETILEPFRAPIDDLGQGRIHSIPGEHDYYARNAIEESLLLGLVRIEEVPIGLTDRGNRREAAIGAWTHHFGIPSEAAYPLSPGSGDSVQFIFFDSALPLRTPPAAWRSALDTLRGILARDRRRPHLLWKVLCTHHPLMSAGEHAGYTVWDDESDTVAYVSPCDRDSNAFAWMRNSLDPEDLCAPRYRDLVDSIRHVIRGGGVKVQIALSAHDRSLQILEEPPRAGGADDPAPSVQIISGAASTPSRVRLPSPPFVFTSGSAAPSDRGVSLPGFVRISFTRERCSVIFYNGNNGDPIDMGGGRKEFHISASGVLTSD